MNKKWVLFPVLLKGGELNSSVPPIPEPVWAEMVERGARALAIEAGEEEWPAKPEFYRFQASSCIRAALGIDRAEKGES